MKARIAVLLIACAAAGSVEAEDGALPVREMNVTQGPDVVFGRPAGEVVTELAGATPTGENGRVGSELVFWGFEQAGGRRVFLFACAQGADVDCASRVAAICPAGGTVVQEGRATGTVVRRQCRTVAFARPGDVRPGCDDRAESVDLAVGLVACG